MISGKEKIDKINQNGDFITGIHNYCDGWCERCSFTSRCLTFALEYGESPHPQLLGPCDDGFWEELSCTFKAASEQIREMLEAHEIDPDSSEHGIAEMEEVADEEIARSHECCRAAMTYGQWVDTWFHQAEDLFWEEGYLEPGEEEDTGPASLFPEADGLTDALEVVRWYQHQIYVKLVRAFRSRLEEAREKIDGFAKDSDGSAKVALIGIDRSLAAWADIRKSFPVMQDKVNGLENALRGLCRRVEAAFPEARAFIRPGFDKIALNG